MPTRQESESRAEVALDSSATTGLKGDGPRPSGGRRLGRSARGDSRLARPLVVLVGLLVLVPIGFLIFGALWTQPPGAPGGELSFYNISQVLTTEEFLRPIANSLGLGLSVGLCSIVAGGSLAWLVTKSGTRRPALWENALLIPVYVSPLMLALAYIAIAAPRVGFINLLLPGDGLLNINTYVGIVWILTVNYSGYVFLYMLGPMRALNAELEEAALVLGSSRIQIVRRIVAPLLTPALFASFIIVFTLAAENFAVPSLIGREIGFRTLPSEIYYNVAYEPTNPNLAAALGLVLLLITFSGIALYRRMIRLAGRYVTIGGKPNTGKIFAARKFRRLPEGLIALWFIVAIGLPMAGLVFGSFLKFISPDISVEMLTLANYRQVFRGDGFLAVRNTLVLALLGASITAFLGATISYTVQRTTARGRGFLDYTSTATVAIPAMALAIGLLWAYVRVPLPIWGTIWILLIAYITRFLSHSVRATSISLLPISTELDESARVVGAGLFRRLTTITFPLMKRGILSAWMLVFIFIVNEVSATIVLFSGRSQTISVRVWNTMQMFGGMQSFAYAAIQTAIVGLVLLGIYLLFGRLNTNDLDAPG